MSSPSSQDAQSTSRDGQNAELLQELADESERLVSMLANALESARDLRDHVVAATVLGLRDGFGDKAVLCGFYKDLLKFMIGSAARGTAAGELLEKLPEDEVKEETG